MVRSHAAMRTFTGKYSEGKMRMVKSLLLGSAAGLVTIAGAQAADLPVKAQAVAVRQDLQPVWRRVLLHPRHRHVPEDWRLGAR